MLKVSEKEALEAIKDFLNLCRLVELQTPEYLYHHNTGYQKAPGIIAHGILSKSAYYEMIGEDIPDNLKKNAADEHCANGLEYISLSQANMTDLYKDEEEFDPTNPYSVDILLPEDLKPRRHTINYGNEFLAKHRIEPEQFRSIDIRILNLIKNFEEKKYKLQGKDGMLSEIISDYNQLRYIAQAMSLNQLDIPLREASKNEFCLDKEMVMQLPKIILKK